LAILWRLAAVQVEDYAEAASALVLDGGFFHAEEFGEDSEGADGAGGVEAVFAGWIAGFIVEL